MKWDTLIDARKQKRLTQRGLAKELGYSYATVSAWERGERAPHLDDWDTLKKLFPGITPPPGRDAKMNRLPEPEPTVVYSGVQIPILGDIPAGNPTWTEGETAAIDYAGGTQRDAKEGAFALRVSGTSMQPRYLPGDVIFLRPRKIPFPVKDPEAPMRIENFTAMEGRCVAVLINGLATLKKLQIERGRGLDYTLVLKPINTEEHNEIRIDGTDEGEFQGEVYKVIREE